MAPLSKEFLFFFFFKIHSFSKIDSHSYENKFCKKSFLCLSFPITIFSFFSDSWSLICATMFKRIVIFQHGNQCLKKSRYQKLSLPASCLVHSFIWSIWESQLGLTVATNYNIVLQYLQLCWPCKGWYKCCNVSCKHISVLLMFRLEGRINWWGFCILFCWLSQ